MIHGKKVVVVMPAYNAEQTLRATYEEIPRDVVDDIVVVDDASSDETVRVCHDIGLHVVRHDINSGYGANQKTCYREALNRGADIVIMLHPDYQYTPKLITAMASLVGVGLYDIVLGSRVLGTGALKGGMPLYKYIANRFLTLVENMLVGYKLAEYHTGYRAFSRKVLETLNLSSNSDDFIFDNQMLVQAIYCGFDIGEITCPTKYCPESSSINFRRSVKYGLGVLYTSIVFRMARWGLLNPEILQTKPVVHRV